MKHNLMKRVLAAALTLTLTAGVGTFSTAVPFTTITVNAEQANSNDGSVFFDADTGTLYLDGHFSEQNVSAFKGEQYEVKHIITMEGSSLPQNCKQLFENFSKVTTIDLRQASAANVNDMSYMFSGCTALTFADLGTMDTKNVTDMSGMFMGCESLKYVDLSGLNTVNVTNMSGMFISCTNLLEVNMAGFNTFKVTDMSRMFAECSNIELIDLTCFDTSGVSRMAGMFYKCYKLREICVSSDTWNVDNVTKSSGMFEGCESLAGEFSTLWSASNPQDKTYAAQNIKDDKPGYLTGTIKVSLPDHVSLTYESASMKLANGDFTSIAVVRLIPDIGYTFSGDIKFNGEVCQPDSDGEYSYVSFGKNVSVTVDSIEKTDRAPDGKGTKDDPYLISNTANWEALGDFLNARGDTIGKYFKLTNDITVQTMVGGDIPFSGIFDGCGHRITADLTSENGCAPFKNIRNAKINSLKISGSVYGGMHSSGLVHSMQNIYQMGNYQFQLPDHSLIEDCYLDVNVKLGSATHAGGVIGHGGTSAATLRGIVFEGTISDATHAATLWGWSDTGSTPNIFDCLDKSSSPYPIGLGHVKAELINNYYTLANKPAGSSRAWPADYQGKFAYTIKAGSHASIDFRQKVRNYLLIS